MKTAKTWNELLDAGYVVELTDEQVATARFAFNPPKPFSYANGDHLKQDEINQKRMNDLKKAAK